MPPVKKPKRHRRPNFLKEWRVYRRLTQEQLAEQIGVDATTVGRIEKNENPYTQDFLELAAEALNCEPADLLMRKPEAETPWSLLESLKQAPESTREQIKAVVETLLKTGS